MSGFIYVIENSVGLYKIGFSVDPSRRVGALATSTAETLTLRGIIPGTMADETELHRLLATWRVAREWFRSCRAIEHLLSCLHEPPATGKQVDEFWLTIREIASVCGVNQTAIYKWQQRGSVPGKWQTRLIAASKGKLKVQDFLQSEAA